MKRTLLLSSLALGALAASCATSGRRSDSVAEAPAALPAGATLTVWTLEAAGSG